MCDPPPLVLASAENSGHGSSAVPPWLKALIGVGGGTVFVLLLCLVVVLFRQSSPVVPSWGAHAVSEDATRVMRIHVAKLQGHEVFREFMRSLPPSAARYPGGLETEDIEDAFVVFTNEERRIAARTREDWPLEDFAVNQEATLECRGTQYVPARLGVFSGGFVARTGDRQFSLTRSEDDMRNLLTRLDDRTVSDIDNVLTEAIRAVSREDHYVAQFTDDSLKSSRGMIGFGIGMSVDAATMDVTGVFVFPSADKAEQFVNEFQKTIDSWHETVMQRSPDDLSRESQAAAVDGLEQLRGARLWRRSRAVHFRAAWPLADVKKLVPTLPEIAGLF